MWVLAEGDTLIFVGLMSNLIAQCFRVGYRSDDNYPAKLFVTSFHSFEAGIANAKSSFKLRKNISIF